jgi:hypothetical protein
MLDFEAAKQVALKRGLAHCLDQPGGPPVIYDDKCEEFEWGWLIGWGWSYPEKVPSEERQIGNLPFLVDRVTGNLEQVSTSGETISIMNLLARRPPSCQSPHIAKEDLGGLVRITISPKALRSLRELENGE